MNAQNTNSAEANNMRAALIAQIPYMRQTVRDLAVRNNLSSAHVVNRNGEAFLSSMENPVLMCTLTPRDYG
jgi:hypothetical protein